MWNKMIKFLLTLLFCLLSSAEKHFLKFYYSGSSGLPHSSQSEVVAEIDGSLIAYCNQTEFKIHDWVKKGLDDDVELLTFFKMMCSHTLPNTIQARISDLKQRFKEPEGVHVFQWIDSCGWDTETGELTGFLQYGYNGEDFIALDFKRLSWIALKQQAIPTKLAWDTDRARLDYNKIFFSQLCPGWLKRSLDYGRNFLMRTELPSLSLLQRSPSAPVLCQATGFYPEKARLFWRKDGEEIHQFMNHEEILPNNDGTFQMSADLNVSSVSAADWWRYDCVFQLLDTEDKIILRLDEAVIKTNKMNPSNIAVFTTIAGMFICALIALGVACLSRKRKKALDRDSDVSEKQNLKN
ncbi:major histocompatibility complex class I-related gene protein-like [Xiphophorus maculatus]|uniref:Major histocompatibility complex class I-related gene protein-like n=1 Tax=Xiphophorus maculatus TaxID=8083 RepID=A0A3B5RE92_XIPMA|nr:major histocompatibility complex class I-related gene protein-like [Xiphophorus maculatus]